MNQLTYKLGTRRLHKEIVDFISYIKPRRYEHSVRRHIIHQIRKSITHSLTDVDVRVFGSFASHLYLPTADLDLAVISRDFATSGYQKYSAKKTLYRVSDLLKRANIPKNGDVTVISGAKVPILKFVERKTGLNVDICFENFSGLTANRTFKEWKEEHKALPPLAVILKHFLDMRKLNEVYNGGLGGFSVICMIVSMLQLHPAVCSGNMKMEENLGIALLDFLKLYGKDFNTENVGIDVVGRGYFRKVCLFIHS